MFSIRFESQGRVSWVHSDNEQDARIVAIALKQAGFETQLWSGMTRLDTVPSE